MNMHPDDGPPGTMGPTQLKYEVFRALRRHDGARAIDLLKDPRSDPNWRHGYNGYSVLMQAFFEDEASVFRYLVERPDLDWLLKDDGGYDIVDWVTLGRNKPTLDYVGVALAAGKKRSGLPADRMVRLTERISVAAEAEEVQAQRTRWDRDVPRLFPGHSYRLRRRLGRLEAGATVRYCGNQEEAAERGWDTYMVFETESGATVSILSWEMPQSHGDSVAVFADLDANFEEYPTAVRHLAQGLCHRLESVRLPVARDIVPPVQDVRGILPLLVRLALEQPAESAYLHALQRLNPEAREYAESLANDSTFRDRSRYHDLLASLGSPLFLQHYHDELKNLDAMRVRNAIRLLHDLGCPDSVHEIRKLLGHKNYNVRLAAKEALASWRFA